MYLVRCCLLIFRRIKICQSLFVYVSFAVESILVMCPLYCIVFSFHILMVRILLVRNDALLVLGVRIVVVLV